MKILHQIAFVLTVIGALDLGLVGLGGFAGADWNVINSVLGAFPSFEWIVYVLIGLSALYLAFTHKKSCTMCSVRM
ncbi:MAG: DUF378 domain-containing protein [Minisyncoccota bacterium]